MYSSPASQALVILLLVVPVQEHADSQPILNSRLALAFCLLCLTFECLGAAESFRQVGSGIFLSLTLGAAAGVLRLVGCIQRKFMSSLECEHHCHACVCVGFAPRVMAM